MQARNEAAEESSSPMEWVEVEGQTVEQAVELAMGELGIKYRDEAAVEVIQEPKPGFLGMGGKAAIVKVTKSQANRKRRRGRGRSAESKSSGQEGPRNQPRAGGRDRKSKDQGTDKSGGAARQGNASTGGGTPRAKKPQSNGEKKKVQRDDRPEAAPIEEQAEVAAAFLSGLLEAFGLEGTVETRIEEDVLYLDVNGEQTEALVGAKGSVMYSVLELTRTVVQRKTYGAPRMRIDVNGYAERRREALKIYTGKLAAQIIEDQNEVMLEAMNAADRKVVHDAVAEIENVRSFSEGEDPRRAVVIAYEAS
jgi:spoIIIJ-associated protein